MSNRAKPDLRWPWWSGRLSRGLSWGHLGIAYLRGHLPCFCHKNSITKAYKSHLESIKWYKALAPRVSKSLNIPESEIPNVGATAIHPDFWWLSAIFRWHIGVMEQGTVNPIRFRQTPTNLAWPQVTPVMVKCWIFEELLQYHYYIQALFCHNRSRWISKSIRVTVSTPPLGFRFFFRYDGKKEKK